MTQRNIFQWVYAFLSTDLHFMYALLDMLIHIQTYHKTAETYKLIINKFLHDCFLYFRRQAAYKVLLGVHKPCEAWLMNSCLVLYWSYALVTVTFCATCFNHMQFHQYLIIHTLHKRTPCLAIRLHPLAVALGKASIGKEVRWYASRLLGEHHSGMQHFLSVESSSPNPIRTKDRCNTKNCKCVFIPHTAIATDVFMELRSGIYTTLMHYVIGVEEL